MPSRTQEKQGQRETGTVPGGEEDKMQVTPADFDGSAVAEDIGQDGPRPVAEAAKVAKADGKAPKVYPRGEVLSSARWALGKAKLLNDPELAEFIARLEHALQAAPATVRGGSLVGAPECPRCKKGVARPIRVQGKDGQVVAIHPSCTMSGDTVAGPED